MTGLVECFENSIISSWDESRSITASTIELITIALSVIGSPLPSCISFSDRKSDWPPSCVIPASKETLVRVDDLSKIIASVLLLSELFR